MGRGGGGDGGVRGGGGQITDKPACSKRASLVKQKRQDGEETFSII